MTRAKFSIGMVTDMAASTLKELFNHEACELRLVEYGDGGSFVLECDSCCEVILEFHEDKSGILQLGPRGNSREGPIPLDVCGDVIKQGAVVIIDDSAALYDQMSGEGVEEDVINGLVEKEWDVLSICSEEAYPDDWNHTVAIKCGGVCTHLNCYELRSL